MVRGWLRRRRSPLCISLIILAALLLPIILNQDGSGIGAEARLQQGHWVVSWVDQEGIAARAGLRVGDIIMTLNWAVPHTRRHTDPGLDLSMARIWEIRRHGMRLVLHLPVENGARSNPVDLLLQGIALAFWGIATFVRQAKPNEALALRFHRLGLAAAVVLGLSPVAANDVLWARVLETLAFALLPALFLVFCIWLTQRTAPTGRTAILVWAFYGGGVSTGGVALIAGLTGSALYDGAHTLLLALLCLGLIGGLGALAHGYAHLTSAQARTQVGIVLLGAAVAALPLTALCLVPESMGLLPLVRPQVAALSTILLPFSIGYAILQYQMWGIALAGRALVHAVMTMLLAACYVLFFYAFDRAGLTRQAQSDPLVVLAFFSVLTLTFMSVRDRVRHLIDHLFYGDRYDCLRTLRALGAQLVSIRPLDEVLSAVAEGLAGALDLSGAAVLLRTPERSLAMRAKSGDCPDAAIGAAHAKQTGSGRRTSGMDASTGQWIPLMALGEEYGLLYLGPKRAPGEFDTAELVLTETIADQVAVAAANALLVERLQDKVTELELLRDRLLQVRDEERKRLAHALHDGALHTVMNVVRQAQFVAQAFPSDQTAAPCLREGLRVLVEQAEDAQYELRLICADLYPSQLAHLGLIAALEYLARMTNRDENVAVSMDTQAYPATLRLPVAVEEALYRVACQALDNVLRHAAAQTVTIELALNGAEVSLRVRDDGEGFVPPTSATALLRAGHLGLVSMRERVEGLGGGFCIVSASGNGTEVRADVPVSTYSQTWHEGER